MKMMTRRETQSFEPPARPNGGVVMSLKCIADTTGADYNRMRRKMQSGYALPDAIRDARQPTGRNHRRWSREEMDTLTDMREAGFTFPEIGRTLGIDGDKCRYAYHYLISPKERRVTLKSRLEDAGIHWAQFQRVRAELRDMGVEHDDQDVIDIVLVRRRK